MECNEKCVYRGRLVVMWCSMMRCGSYTERTLSPPVSQKNQALIGEFIVSPIIQSIIGKVLGRLMRIHHL